jgi:hypothetical protein
VRRLDDAAMTSLRSAGRRSRDERPGPNGEAKVRGAAGPVRVERRRQDGGERREQEGSRDEDGARPVEGPGASPLAFPAAPECARALPLRPPATLPHLSLPVVVRSPGLSATSLRRNGWNVRSRPRAAITRQGEKGPFHLGFPPFRDGAYPFRVTPARPCR